MTTTNPFSIYSPGPAFSVGSPLGWRTRNKVREYHRGQDYPAPQGTPILAAAEGTVYRVEDLAGYGHCVVIRESKGSASQYFLNHHATSPTH